MKNLVYYLLTFYALVCVLTITFFNGTGDSGDSITHYLFAKYAPLHPVLYLDHWAKPVFVLLASPFAQLGFTGIKVFNALVSLGVLFYTYKAAELLKIRNPGLVIIFLIFSPLFYILTFSGLTEPLFALFTVLGIYFCSGKSYFKAAIFISFLPYVRSEGLIIIGVFGLYFLYKKLWKPLPVLLFGSFVYGLIGLIVFGNFFWVFTEIPYAKLSSVYGKGTLLHFVEELINVTGVPVYLLFWTGFLYLILSLIKRKVDPERHILVWFGFCAFFVAHSLFWYLGIFSSMGLKRVLIGIMPLIALIALEGFNVINEWSFLNQNLKKIVQVVLIVYVLLFPFVPNPASIHWEKDMRLSPDQKLAIQSAEFVLKKKVPDRPILYSHNYLSLALDRDYFDTLSRKQISVQNIDQMKPGDLLIWDNYYSDVEAGFKKEALDQNPRLVNLVIYKSSEQNKESVFSVYQKK